MTAIANVGISDPEVDLMTISGDSTDVIAVHGVDNEVMIGAEVHLAAEVEVLREEVDLKMISPAQ